MSRIPRRRPWLVAAWPGMGGVAQIAATHLAAELHVPLLEDLDVRRFFEPSAIQVERGIVLPWRSPRSLLHGAQDRQRGSELLVLLSEQQPVTDLGGYARLLLDRCRRFGIERVVTFAAMSTQIHPRTQPRVFASATDTAVLREALAAGAVPLAGGEISGMNGLMLGIAAECGLPALALLGEMPFFAAALPNPKSSAAVLRVFARMSGIELGLGDLDENARRIEEALVQNLPDEAVSQQPRDESEPRTSRIVEPEVQQRIETLFGLAAGDRSKALELKALLDEHDLFRRYEDRFLDLFRRGS